MPLIEECVGSQGGILARSAWGNSILLGSAAWHSRQPGRYPLITPNGLSRATFLAIPASDTVFTTMSTSL